ncbi:MAG: TonB-dependent receptor plug domain-containing protein, partial [Acinetobacter pittii]|nr:TonB-dependent receptor plug domain-containing protein [Acinetobacter pittii]
MYLNNLKYVGALKKKRSFIFVFVALFHPLESYAQEAVEQPQKQAKTDKVVRVAVTGSRISKAQKDGPTSVTVITAADIEKQGFSNAFDALNNLTQNTGFVQGADYGNTFTPAANAISLRGLGPNHTLTLINGHRVADYPVPYDGSVNFVNLANIPTAIIDRIEILNGGASAIYGSDAIAGVVNIILKKKTDGTQFNIKAGGTKEGGENLRLQLSGSKTLDKLSLVYGVELSGREPI